MLKKSTSSNQRNSLLLESFLEMISAEKSAAKNTIYSYRLDLENFLKFLQGREVKVEKVTQQVITSYITELGRAKLSSRSVARKISSIKHFFKFLISDGIIKENPGLYVEMPKLEKLLPKALSLNDVEKMLATIDLNSDEGIRDKCMMEILYSSGMRVTELIQLKLSSIQKNIIKGDSHSAIIIKGKGGKERVVILNSSAMTALQKYFSIRSIFLRGLQSDYLFPSFTKQGKVTHISRQRFHQIIKQIAINANVNPESVSPHKMRHSFASHLLHNGADLRVVQELLGHADISSTQIYTKILSHQAKNLVLDAHPLSKKE